MASTTMFPHEKLEVYREAIAFDGLAGKIVAECSRRWAFVDHLDRAAGSIVESIVCGNGKWTPDARSRHFGIAYGSALECAACLDVGCVRRVVPSDQCRDGKKTLLHVVRMLVGLIRSQRVGFEIRESSDEYRCEALEAAVEVLL